MKECLFITGATGFIGRPLVQHLLAARPERRIVALVRDPARGRALAEQGVELVTGDVTRPSLGLDDKDYARLAAQVTQVLHGAGDINFGASLSVSRNANVFGTQQALQFARACPGLERFGHLSTISVQGLRPGALPEAPSPVGHRFVNSYQQSKHEAEWLVLRASREIPAEIFRISLVAADSANGEVSQFNYVHHLLRYLPNSPLPVMPGDLGTCVDLIPADWAIAALAYLFDNRFQGGAIRNLSAGPKCSLTLEAALQIGSAAMEQHSGAPVRFPRCVSAAEFERIIAASSDTRVREAAAILGPHINLLSARQWFSNEKTLLELEGSGLEAPPLGSWFARMIDYCLRENWGGGAEAGAAWSMVGARPVLAAR